MHYPHSASLEVEMYYPHSASLEVGMHYPHFVSVYSGALPHSSAMLHGSAMLHWRWGCIIPLLPPATYTYWAYVCTYARTYTRAVYLSGHTYARAYSLEGLPPAALTALAGTALHSCGTRPHRGVGNIFPLEPTPMQAFSDKFLEPTPTQAFITSFLSPLQCRPRDSSVVRCLYSVRLGINPIYVQYAEIWRDMYTFQTWA